VQKAIQQLARLARAFWRWALAFCGVGRWLISFVYNMYINVVDFRMMTLLKF